MTGRPSAKREQLAGAKGLGEQAAGVAVTHGVRRGQTKRLKAGNWRGHIDTLQASGSPSRGELKTLHSPPPFQGKDSTRSRAILGCQTGRCSWHLAGRSQRCC